MQTTSSQIRIKEKTLLTRQEQAAITSERAQLELLWSCASARFKKDYTAFLALKVQQSREAYNASRRQISRLHPTGSFIDAGRISHPLFLNFSRATTLTVPSSTIETPYLFTSDKTKEGEKEAFMNLHLESANETLEQAARFGLRAARRIATLIYRAYDGIGRLALPGIEGKNLVSTDEALDLITRRVDNKTFSIALLSATELQRLSREHSAWLRPDLRKECLGLALQRLMNQLVLRY